MARGCRDVTYRLLWPLLACVFNDFSMTVGDLKRLFGTAIKSQRSELGISQEELAERAGLHRTYISDVERGVRNPSLESIEKLAAALDLSVSHLFHRANAGGGGGEELEILLIEDEPADVQLTIRAFRRAGVTNHVRVASDGEAALDFLCGNRDSIVRGKTPGVILLDLHLPKLSGLEVLRRIKADKRTRNIPVIVLTSSQQDEDVAECARLGVENYIVKPVDFQNFSEVTPLLKFKWALVRPA